MEERLQRFARLTEIGNFTKAARALHISQPALSMAVDKLEQELGTELLIRDSRKFKLTEAGKAAYNAAVTHQNTTDNLHAELNRITKQRPIVAIGMTDSVAAILCATDEFDELEQTAHVTVTVNNSRYLRDAVEQRQLDVAFIVDDGVEHQNVYKKIVGSEELVLVCHPDLLAQTEHDLANGYLRNFICYDKPSTTYRHIIQTLQTQNIKPQISLFSTSPDVLLGMAQRGKGVGVLPRFLIETGNYSLVSPLINGETLTFSRPIALVTPQGKVLPPYLKKFVEAGKF